MCKEYQAVFPLPLTFNTESEKTVSEGVVTPLGGWNPGPFTLGCLDRGLHPP